MLRNFLGRTKTPRNGQKRGAFARRSVEEAHPSILREKREALSLTSREIPRARRARP
jgi:hypothetical protein